MPRWLSVSYPLLLTTHGWPADLADGDILERLLALNLERAEEQEG